MSRPKSGGGSRIVAASPWILLMLPIHTFFVGCGIYIVGGFDGRDKISLAFGIFILTLSIPVAIIDLSMRIVVADSNGFHALLRRRIRWIDVQYADVVDFAPGLLPNVTVRVVGKQVDPKTGKLREYLVPGLGGFVSGARLQRTVSKFNDWMQFADPDWVVNPWVHRSDREDNR